jgi:hypothetical protein
MERLTNNEKSFVFIVEGDNREVLAHELTIKENDTLRARLVNSARTEYQNKHLKVAHQLNGKDKSEYLVTAINSMPDYESSDHINGLLFSNLGIKYLLETAVKGLSLSVIDNILNNADNGAVLSLLIRFVLSGKEDTVEVQTSATSPNE